MTSSPAPSSAPTRRQLRSWAFDLLLVYILLLGAYFRFAGLNWGDNQYLHPDERFLIWVTADIKPVERIADYFNTPISTLNPNNVGHGFYVYGTLPVFLARYLTGALYPASGWAEITVVGRSLSALADLLTGLLVYLVAERLFNRRVGILAAAFYALAVLPIQLSHFYKEDTFTNFFAFLAIYFAVRLSLQASGRKNQDPAEPAEVDPAGRPNTWAHYLPAADLGYSLLFGLALGCAVASKINAAPVAALLPAAFALALYNRFRKTPDTAERKRWLAGAAICLVLGAFVSLLTFRLLQPYAFSGPGIFGLKLNPQWVSNLRELRLQTGGNVDFPPALQWARRPITFAGWNLTVWGLGLPLGLLAWTGFLWAGWRILATWGRPGGEWQRHLLLWGWTAFYFAWQSLASNPTMRYLLPVYPALAIFAGWAVVELFDRRRLADGRAARWARWAGLVAGGIALAASLAWAFAFTRTYTRPVTRVEASRWVYQNVPGPLNLQIKQKDSNGGGVVTSQPLPFVSGTTLTPGLPYVVNIDAAASGELTGISLGYVSERSPAAAPAALNVSVVDALDTGIVLGTAQIELPAASANLASQPYVLTFPEPLSLTPGQSYLLRLEVSSEQAQVDMCGSLSVRYLGDAAGSFDQQLYTPAQCLLNRDQPVEIRFAAQNSGYVDGLVFTRLANLQPGAVPVTLTFTVNSARDPQVQTTGTLSAELDHSGNPRGQAGLSVQFERPLPVEKGRQYTLQVEVTSPLGAVTFSGAALANETSWDDAIPVRMDGYDGYGGIYSGDLNFEMYFDDNADKLARFISNLDQADYIFITSNRQWGTTTRVPERYPLTTEYYRRLIGCPAGRSVIACYNQAQVGDFQGELGFELIKVFESSPNIGPLRINDQPAEEAFTVYDHPKVFIFKKTDAYDPQQPRAILGAVDLSMVVRVIPGQAASRPANLMLPSFRWESQQLTGTWSQLFNLDALVNRSQWAAVIVWYLAVALLGWLVYPLLRLALPGLADHGYPLARTAGLLLLSYLVWLAGSFQVPVTRLTISGIVALLALAGGVAAFGQRAELRRELGEQRRYFLAIEGLFLAFFVFDLLIRYGNPDLWHPWKGGEKPMDFAYFNAVLKSNTFPPYDPWFAGGYLNYYYYGFVLVGMLVKWLGIVPAVAYNLILPTVFALIAMGAFCIGWNLFTGRAEKVGNGEPEAAEPPVEAPDATASAGPNNSTPVSDLHSSRLSPYITGLAAALGMAVLGNLGTVRMIFQGYQKLVAPDGNLEGASLLTHWLWALQGFLRVLSGAQLPYSIGDWYWNPSRVIPAPNEVEPITEFPFFTVLYADPHAHLFAMPVALLALGFVVSVILALGRWRNWAAAGMGLALGGLAIGALRPTNTWDFYTYMVLAPAVLAYAMLAGRLRLRNGEADPSPGLALPSGIYAALCGAMVAVAAFISVRFGLSFALKLAGLEPSTDSLVISVGLPLAALAIALTAGLMAWQALSGPARLGLALVVLKTLFALGILVGLSILFYQPYASWYGQGYNQVTLWKGTHTPLSAYLTHWGLFLFVIVSWMAWETRDWMASTPLSSLRKLDPYKSWILSALGLLFFLILALQVILKVAIAWFVLPLAAWAGVLILRPKQPAVKRLVLFLVGTGLTLTLMVEIIVLVGDIARMNTVFKFYLQVWAFFAISAAAALGWLLAVIPAWNPRPRALWQAALAVLVFGAGLYTLLGATAKVKDRMTLSEPHTLDGMAYMAEAHYLEEWGEMDLSQDYRAIRWMQANVSGSPVIVEANLRNLYRWGSRFSIYTGLPGVVGWEWHQQQQRAVLPGGLVSNRIAEVDTFYQTTDLQQARDFLRKYNAGYIVLGQQERGHYPGPGLDKFAAANGVLWKEVYRDGDTLIYEVMR